MAKSRGLVIKYAQSGFGENDYTPKQILENDKSGLRRALVSGEPIALLSSIGILQREVPIVIESFKIGKGEFRDKMDMIIKIKGGIK